MFVSFAFFAVRGVADRQMKVKARPTASAHRARTKARVPINPRIEEGGGGSDMRLVPSPRALYFKRPLNSQPDDEVA